ncbi:sensory rhodopsin transducer [Methylibium sp.]|uniref:sensory rhodopsin transducer n=1 Tax=Methylibium sp. TaxID=2067992 RepID=UPI00345BEBCF
MARGAHWRPARYFHPVAAGVLGAVHRGVGAVQQAGQRTVHLRFDGLKDVEPVPRGRPCASVIESDVPVVVQHTRLDSRQAEFALLSTLAIAGDA